VSQQESGENWEFLAQQFLSYMHFVHCTESVISQLTLTSGSFVMQMAGRLFWEVRPDGSVRTDGLHLEGFARILWDALRSSGYPTPPTYKAMETTQLGVPRCRVQVSVPLHPDHP
jgi:hypothetical protein